MAKPSLKVTGQADVDKAFGRLSASLDDMTDANTEAAQRLLPDVKTRTRHATGTLADSWIGSGTAKQAQFTNPQSYAVTQEYGSKARGIEPTLAVASALEANPDGATQPYSDAIERRAKRADIRTK